MNVATSRQEQDWDEMAALDPYWAVVSEPDKQFGRWKAADFFATGEADVARLMHCAAALGHPQARESALDFGCGLGRLTVALSSRFVMCHGVDISQTMITQAAELARGCTNCHFVVNSEDHLRQFSNGTFDLVYSHLVLQHIAKRSTVETYIGEFLRILKPGGLVVFQLPSRVHWRRRLQPRRRAYEFLRRLGVNQVLLYRKLRLHPMSMSFIPELNVTRLLERLGGHVLDIQTDRAGPYAESKTYYVTRFRGSE